ncbi:aldolase/citrate lyase family protein [Bordetella sp. 2513F-2]
MILVTGADRAGLDAAVQSGADIVCVDLEDTVDDKAAARRLLQVALQQGYAGEIAVRINPVGTKEGLEDLLLLQSLAIRPALVVLTMAEHPGEVRLAARILPDTPLMVIIETAQALDRAPEFLMAATTVQAAWLGGKDLSYALACDRAHGLEWARGRVVVAAAMAGIPVLDDIYRPFEDLQGLAAACADGRARGLHGKVTLDPRQVPVINQALAA